PYPTTSPASERDRARRLERARVLVADRADPADDLGPDAGDDQPQDGGDAVVEQHPQFRVVRGEQVTDPEREPVGPAVDELHDAVGRVGLGHHEHHVQHQDQREDQAYPAHHTSEQADEAVLDLAPVDVALDGGLLLRRLVGVLAHGRKFDTFGWSMPWVTASVLPLWTIDFRFDRIAWPTGRYRGGHGPPPGVVFSPNRDARYGGSRGACAPASLPRRGLIQTGAASRSFAMPPVVGHQAGDSPS